MGPGPILSFLIRAFQGHENKSSSKETNVHLETQKRKNVTFSSTVIDTTTGNRPCRFFDNSVIVTLKCWSLLLLLLPSISSAHKATWRPCARADTGCTLRVHARAHQDQQRQVVADFQASKNPRSPPPGLGPPPSTPPLSTSYCSPTYE